MRGKDGWMVEGGELPVSCVTNSYCRKSSCIRSLICITNLAEPSQVCEPTRVSALELKTPSSHFSSPTPSTTISSP